MTEPAISWREQAVSRSLDSARARAEKRVQRFLDAALELMNSSPDKDITVQEVIDKSGQSLRSFYQHFAGKHELLLALFEEAVRSTAEQLQSRIEPLDDPLEKLHTLVVEYHRICRPSGHGRRGSKALTPGMADFAQQLLTKQPGDASRAFAPLAALFDRILNEAAAAGAVRADVPIVGVLMQAIMFNAFTVTISGARTHKGDPGEQLWDLMFNGMRVSR